LICSERKGTKRVPTANIQTESCVETVLLCLSSLQLPDIVACDQFRAGNDMPRLRLSFDPVLQCLTYPENVDPIHKVFDPKVFDPYPEAVDHILEVFRPYPEVFDLFLKQFTNFARSNMNRLRPCILEGRNCQQVYGPSLSYMSDWLCATSSGLTTCLGV
uniref:ULP_PROTEASE domain-containing protein n=1 Tax=Macrostomum lignano TaxID=282301 RepID=A0A1I8JPG9_9PLAT